MLPVPVTTQETSQRTSTVVSTVTPVTRDASRQDALDITNQLLGTNQELLRSSDGTVTGTHEPTDHIPGAE